MSLPDTRPAFPSIFTNDTGRNATSPDGHLLSPNATHHMPGMTMRQHYAGLALQGYLASCVDAGPPASQVGRECWQLADAVLAAEHADMPPAPADTALQAQLVEALNQAHSAIDSLMAQLIERDPSFKPTRSTAWNAMLAVTAARKAAGAV